MVLDHRLDRRQLDLLVHPDRLGRQVGRERRAAARAVLRPMIDDPIRLVAQGSAVTLMAWLCSAGLRGLALLLPIGRRRLRRGARRLLRPLQAQHQINQLRLAQALELIATHPRIESDKSRDR